MRPNDDHPSAGYPRPQLVREDYESLDGPWGFAIDSGRRWL